MERGNDRGDRITDRTTGDRFHFYGSDRKNARSSKGCHDESDKQR